VTAPRTRPTIEDVAARAEVSVATVSRALRGLPNVAPATRDRVRSAADELRYEVDPQASRLATGRTMTIGLVAPLFGLWYADRVVAGAETVLAEAGYDLLVASVHDRPTLDAFLDRTRSFGRRIDGALVIDLYADGHQLARLSELAVPVVTVGEDLGHFASVTIDNQRAAREATEHLIGLGHTRIGLVGGTQTEGYLSPVPQRRQQGWEDAQRAAGIEPDSGLVVDGQFTAEGGRAAMARLLALPEPPTAVFCASDRMAIGALHTAHRLGFRVPGDLSVVGFDDDDLALAFELTTMGQPVEALGADAATALLDAIGGTVLERAPRVHPVALAVRDTTGSPG